GCAMERQFEIAETSGASAFGTAVGDEDGVFCQQLDERVRVPHRRGLHEEAEQALVHFARRHEESLLGSDMLARPFEELSTRRLVPVDQRPYLGVIEVEDIVKQEHRALGRTKALQQDEEGHRYLL